MGLSQESRRVEEKLFFHPYSPKVHQGQILKTEDKPEGTNTEDKPHMQFILDQFFIEQLFLAIHDANVWDSSHIYF